MAQTRNTSRSTTPASANNKVSRVPLLLLILPLLGLLVAAGMLLSNAANAVQNQTPPTPGPVTLPALPDANAMANAASIPFELATLNGGQVSLSDYEGRIVFLNFWATWCEPCQRELPAFEEFTRANTGNNSPIILAVNLQETVPEIRSYLQAAGVDGFHVLLDSDGTVADSYGVFQLPVTFVIDQQGVVRYPKYGEMKLEELNSYVDALSG
jgi:thiol-disulfide isomerase/thioredoxin